MSDISLSPSLEQELVPLLAGGNADAAFNELTGQFPDLQTNRENLPVLQRWVDLSLQFGQAQHAFDVLEYCANYPDAEMDLMEGLCRIHMNDRDEAMELLDSARSNPDALPGTKARSSFVWLMERGNELRSSGESAAAIEHYQQASDIRPDLPAPYVCMGLCQNHLGDIAAAESMARKALDCEQPGGEVEAYHLLSQCGRIDDAAAMIESISALLENPRLGDRERTLLLFARGRFLNMEKNYQEAFDNFTAANDLRAAKNPYHPEVYDDQMDALTEVFTKEVLEKTYPGANDREGLIFIIGMPRSGTTLCEQILAAHPDVHAGGEIGTMNELLAEVSAEFQFEGSGWCDTLNEEDRQSLAQRYLDSLHPDSSRFRWHTDKLPFNFLSVGLIAHLFPKAQFLFCRRHPYDIAVSNLEQHFTEVHPFALSLERIAHFTRGAERLTQHWIDVLPERFHTISYEALAGSPAEEIPKMLETLGVPWNEACLSPEKAERSVTTASSRQVRQAIYTSSSDKWQRYTREQLAPLYEALPDPEDCEDFWPVN